uniref:Uncharacterized protein n=1 Tax=viral metagenome TaxID=1070528 RepID=A0A6H1ZPN4_9ZZZZ
MKVTVLFTLAVVIVYSILFYEKVKEHSQEKMRVTGWDGATLIYEDNQNQTYKRGADGVYISTGKIK